MKHKVSTLLYIIALMVIAMGATSCSDPRTYDHYKSVSLQGWSRKDTLTFDIPRQWEGNYQLDLCLRAVRSVKRLTMIPLIVRLLTIKEYWWGIKVLQALRYVRQLPPSVSTEMTLCKLRYIISWVVSRSLASAMLVLDLSKNKN